MTDNQDEVLLQPRGEDPLIANTNWPRTGLVAVVKRDCPTCQLIVPALQQIVKQGEVLRVVSQDDPDFPELEGHGHERPIPIHDSDLRRSHELAIEIVPTLLRFTEGHETERAIGWNRDQWQQVSAIDDLAPDLPEQRPGCGALNLEPRHLERLNLASVRFHSRRVVLGAEEDEFEALYARGWTDGLPVIPPTPLRVARMLRGTQRAPDQVLGTVAPDLVDCTVEKVAVNAVMAGCRPDFLPVVLAAVEAACEPAFNWHGLAATTYFSGPVVIVNGPIIDRVGLNSGINALGQGCRANSTIGRALALTLRNVGGARPGEIDRATLGNPGKLSFCIAEREYDSPFTSLAESRGVARGSSAVTLFAGEGPRGVVDQLSREPESLVRSLAWSLRGVAHPKLIVGFDALLVVSPEHARVFKSAGWSREDLLSHLHADLQMEPDELIRGAHGCAEGLPEKVTSKASGKLPKFRPDGLLMIHAGGDAGLFSAVIGGWASGEIGSAPVTRVIDEI